MILAERPADVETAEPSAKPKRSPGGRAPGTAHGPVAPWEAATDPISFKHPAVMVADPGHARLFTGCGSVRRLGSW
jgi:hypothetical protein